MSFLRSLDATTVASRGSAAFADPAAWAMPIPLRPVRPAPEPAGPYSWWTLPTNPKAALVTAVVATMLAGERAGDVLGRARGVRAAR